RLRLVSAPPPKDIRIMLMSDLNSRYGSTEYEPEVYRTLSFIPVCQPDLIICAGDMIAGQKRTLTKEQIQAMWRAFDSKIAQPIYESNIPFAFTLGNHDASGSKAEGVYIFQNERELAQQYWQQQINKLKINFVDKNNFPFYYSFIQQDIFYSVWDASTHLVGDEQLIWIENSLKSPIAQAAKMRLVIGHLPFYPVAVGRDKYGGYLAQAEQLRKLLEKYNVHTYISGHHHAYFPGKRGKLELLYNGALGGGPRQLLDRKLPPRKTFTLMDIDLTSLKTIYTTFDLKNLEIVANTELPEIISSPQGKILRRDVNLQNSGVSTNYF
ncbi:MAG: metallophosphoesterase, partial [Cyanobacteria bacterium J083]